MMTLQQIKLGKGKLPKVTLVCFGHTYKTRKEIKKNSCQGCAAEHTRGTEGGLCDSLRTINIGQPYPGTYGACGGGRRIWKIKEVK